MPPQGKQERKSLVGPSIFSHCACQRVSQHCVREGGQWHRNKIHQRAVGMHVHVPTSFSEALQLWRGTRALIVSDPDMACCKVRIRPHSGFPNVGMIDIADIPSHSLLFPVLTAIVVLA